MSSENQWFGVASDTGNVLAGTPLGALLSGSGAAAGFSIDYERVPHAIADLEHAAKFFRDRAVVAQGLATAANPIPPVKNPRDVAAMARRPCELLTAKQATGFGLDLPPEQLDGLRTLRCKWTNILPATDG